MSSHWRWNISLSSVQSLSHVQLCDPKDCSTPGLPVHHQLPEFTQTHVHWSSNHLILCRPLLLLPSIFPSIRVFSNELFTSGGQTIEASASVLPMNIQGWFPLGLTGLTSLLSNFFHLVMGFFFFRIWTTQQICTRYYYLDTSERSQSSGYRGWACPGKNQ